MARGRRSEEGGRGVSEDNELDGMAAYIHAINNPSRDDPTWPLPSFDARDWAEAFCKQYPGMDEKLILSWFASALMRGYDEHARRVTTKQEWGQGARATADSVWDTIGKAERQFWWEDVKKEGR